MANANIFQSLLAPPKSVIDYQNDYENADALRNRNALQALTLQQQSVATQQALQERNALQRVAAASGGDRTALIAGLRNSGLPGLMTQADSLEQSGAKLAESQSTAAKNNADAGKTTQATQQTNYTQAMQKVLAFQSPADAIASLNAAVASGKIDMAHGSMMMNSIPQNDPAAFDTWKRNWAVGIADPAKMAELMKPHINVMNTGSQQITQAVNPITLRPTTVSTVANTVSPDTVANNQTSRSNNAATIAKDLTVAGLNPDGSVKALATDGSGKIDLSKVAPEDLAAAYRYKTDGTLPPNMGRGQQGAVESRKLRAIASALDDQSGESPEDARIRQLALKGDVSAINKMRQREVAVGANVKNFDFNADQVMQLSGQVDRTGVPIVNAWMNAGRRAVTGNPQLAAFDTALKTTVNEFAQIVSGTTSGATTEGEKKKAEALLNAQQTAEGVAAVINQMRVESKNRMSSFAAQRQQSMPTNRGMGAPAAPGAGAVVNFSDLK